MKDAKGHGSNARGGGGGGGGGGTMDTQTPGWADRMGAAKLTGGVPYQTSRPTRTPPLRSHDAARSRLRC